MNNVFNEITEVCPHCEIEITMQWNVEESGYKAWLEWLQQPAEGEEDKNEVT